MFKNYFKTAFRNLTRYKGFAVINILSLSIAITGCLVIGLFVWDELQYDKFLKEGKNIYRFHTKKTENTGTTTMASVAPMYATYTKQNYPEVQNTVRLLMFGGKLLLETPEVSAYEENGHIADSTFFDVFPLTFKKGNPATALMLPTSIVITEKVADKYFKGSDPMGKTLKVDKTDFIVTGVLQNVPNHFHLDISYLMPLSSAGLPAERMQRWTWQQFYTYVKLKPGTNVENLVTNFQQAVKKEAAPREAQADEAMAVPYLQPLHDIHLKSADFLYDNAKRGNADYVKGLTIIALFVLLIACFNFINLATARSFRRAKEIGVRKVVGAERGQLVMQFTCETILLATIAFIISIGITLLILPALNNFTEKQISWGIFMNPIFLVVLIVIAIVIGMLAGIYPAMVMSGFQPIKVLKGSLPSTTGLRSASLRQVLVIVQFALSALLIICTTIVYRQINYLHDKDLGFNKEQLLYFSAQGDLSTRPEAFKQELLRSPGVVSATYGYGLPGDQLAGDGVKIPGKDGDINHPTTLLIGDYDYVKTLGLQLIAGRDFSRQFPTDTAESFIINETAVKEFGFGTPQAALGQKMNWDKWIPDSVTPVKKGKVIGVVKDFHYKSLHEKVNKAVIQIYPPIVSKFALKVKTENLQSTIADVKTAWTKFAPNYPLDYSFLDENFAKMYKSEDKLSSLLWIFTLMAIFVGCIGLFGLAAFSAEQRVKEIGIRKVLGASVIGIVSMLSKSFLKPVVIASLIAFPIAWWAMSKWLEDFPYRVNISWWVFALAAVAALVIALITVSFQAIKAAISNPVKSLRTE